MAYIPNDLKKHRNQIDSIDFGDDIPMVTDMISIDYAYHYDTEDYDNGLSFLDRIYAKIGRFHPEWEDVDILKNRIRNSDNKENDYVDMISMLFENPEDIAYYGI